MDDANPEAGAVMLLGGRALHLHRQLRKLTIEGQGRIELESCEMELVGAMLTLGFATTWKVR